jgi:Carbohydrate binding domain
MAVDIAWLACDLVSGQIIEELADLRPTGPLRRLLGEDQSMQLTLPIPLAGTHGAPPAGWEAATSPGRTMVVAVLAGQPVWAGIVLVRAGGSGPLLTLGTVTPEGYLGRRHVGNHTWLGKDEASVIAAGLLKDAAPEGIGLVIDAPPTGKKRDRHYFATDNKTIKSALQELAGVIDGVEWTVDLEWADPSQTAVRKVARVRKRIGVVAPDGGPVVVYGASGAAAVFDTPGAADARYDFTEDYSEGHGSNHVTAWSSGEGADMPVSSPARDEALLDSGFPRYEDRFQPSTSIINKATLDKHAQERLALVGRGITALTITARADAYPLLGADWRLGDEIGYELVGHRHPAGLVGQARAVGWELEPQLGTVSPILLTPPGGFASPEVPNRVENPSFEESTEGWAAGGTVPPTIARSSVRAYQGGWSLLVTWGTGGAFPQVQTTLDNLVPGNRYDASAWVYVPAGGRAVQLAVGGISQGDASAVQGTWEQLAYSWVATATAHSLQLWPFGAPTAGQQVYLDMVEVFG